MGHSDPYNNITLALIAVIAIVVVALFLSQRRCHDRGQTMTADAKRRNGFVNWGPNLTFGYPYNHALDCENASGDPAEVAQNRMYSTAEVDPLVTGQLYAGPRAAGPGQRFIYGGRTAHGDKWGLHEFSTGVPGQAGVDVGLLGMREYSLDDRPDVFDDGIPENWQLPSTPVNWYVPQGRDYYDVEANGAGVYKAGLMSLQEPDHEVLSN